MVGDKLNLGDLGNVLRRIADGLDKHSDIEGCVVMDGYSGGDYEHSFNMSIEINGTWIVYHFKDVDLNNIGELKNALI
jgi:hypothetical protein